MWKEYGNNGNGAALILKIDNNNRFDWFNFHLSKVYYGENEQIKFLQEFIAKTKQFLKDNRASFLNFHNFLLQFLSMHKSSFYVDENEVRLITKMSNDMTNITFPGSKEEDFFKLFKVDFHLNSSDGFKNYINLNLRNNYQDDNFKHLQSQNIPSVKVDKIILGYKYSALYAEKLEKRLNIVNTNNNQPHVKVEVSWLKKELGF